RQPEEIAAQHSEWRRLPGSARRSSISHDSVGLERLPGAHSSFEGVSNGLLGSGFRQGVSKDFSLRGLRNHTNSVDVSENNVTWQNSCSLDLNGEAKINHLAARPLVLSIRTV